MSLLYTVEDVPFHLSTTAKESHWRSMSKAAAFLKHADRDGDASLSLSQIDNNMLLMHACSAYADVTHAPTPKMIAYYTFWSISPERRDTVDNLSTQIAAALEPLSPSGRRRACAKHMRILKREMG
jgi:hypothetical protein